MQRKVPKFDNKEDILTSNVFGLLDILDYKYLLQILSNATNHKQVSLKERLENKKIKSVELWRWFAKYGEPDVYITLDDETAFIIEVKYFGGEHNKKVVSDEDINNEYIEMGQLKKYLEITKENNNFIVYLTASYLSLENLSEDSKKCADQIYHLHWKDFNKYLKENCKNNSSYKCEKKVIEKVTNYLDYKGFKHWGGFSYEYDEVDIDIDGFYNKI